MKPRRYTIDELGNLSGFTRRTIRYYIQEGLLGPPAGRGRGGFYFDSHLETLRRIRVLQTEHVGLAAIAEILRSGTAPAPEAPIRGEREVCVKYRIRPGIEIQVDRDLEEGAARRVAQVVRVARAILSQGRK